MQFLFRKDRKPFDSAETLLSMSIYLENYKNVGRIFNNHCSDITVESHEWAIKMTVENHHAKLYQQ